MGWPTKFTKSQIAEALNNGQQNRVVNNGWVRLASSTSAPVNLGDLKTPGNYVTSYWLDGPSLGKDVISPLNIVVTMINGDTYQFINAGEKKFHRIMTSDTHNYGEWTMPKIEGVINPGPTAPISPIDNETVWLDTTNSEAPCLKVFVNKKWKEVIPEGSMNYNIYDSSGLNTDIFKYIDDAITDASLNEASTAYNAHISDNNIHVTTSEKEKWNTAVTNTDVDSAVEVMKSKMRTIVSDNITNVIADANTLTPEINTLKSEISAHTNNSIIHPSQEKQLEWDRKAEDNHTHELDGNVTVNISNVEGEINSSLLPYDIKERVYVVGSIDAMHKLTKNPVHNGDIICVEDASSKTWYYVINDSYLGTESAASAFKRITKNTLGWADVANKPTTISGYGITNAAEKTAVTNLNTSVTTVSAGIPAYNFANAATLEQFYTNAVNRLMELDAQLPNALESAVTSLEAMVKNM